MTRLNRIVVYSILLSILLLQLTILITAFGGDNGSFGEFQPNPFLSPSERERAMKKQQKLEANRLIEDPKPASIQNGPPSDYKFDQELPLTIGDVIPLNNDHLRPILNELVQTAFFRYYKVNLHSQCPYWAMNRMCTSGGGCNVCECTENEIPKPWRIESTDPVANTLEQDVFRDNDDHIQKQRLLSNWDINVWSDAEKEQGDQTATYVNLLENVEGNTGYNGEEPRRIWDAIYNENCFARIGHNNITDMCFQDRLMYRLISGLHTSISAHVFKHWKLNDDWTYIHNQFLWNMLFTTQEHNMDPIKFKELSLSKDPIIAEKYKKIIESDARVLERVNNLFFTLEMLLESLSTLYHSKIIPFTTDLTEQEISESIVINTGDYDQDVHTANLLSKLVEHAYNRASYYTPSTTSSIAQALIPPPTMHSTFASLGQDHINNMRHLFHNVSIIMNCVGCEKCRIWSKLNILGIATGLKLASSQSTKTTQTIISNLKRNELIAFVNTVNSFSEAVHFINTLSEITPGLQPDHITDAVDRGSKQQHPPHATTTTTTTEQSKTTTTTPKPKPKKDHKFSYGQQIILVLIAMTTIGIIYWRLSAANNDPFASYENAMNGYATNTKQKRTIPIQQLERMKRDQAEFAKAQALFAGGSGTNSNSNPQLSSSTTQQQQLQQSTSNTNPTQPTKGKNRKIE